MKSVSFEDAAPPVGLSFYLF